MLQPLNRVDISGTVKTDGTVVIPASKMMSPNIWQLVTFTGQQTDATTGKVTGNPSWSIQFDTMDIKFGQGARTEIGPMIVPLRSTPSVSVIGGQAGANINGSFMGSFSQDFREVVANFIPIPNPPSIGVTSPGQSLLINATVPLNSVQGFDVPTMPGMHGIAVLSQVTAQGTTNMFLVSAIGNDTGASYLSLPTGQLIPLNNLAIIPVVVPQPPVDKTIHVTVQNGSITTNFAVWIFAVFDVEALDVFSNSLSFLGSVDVTDRGTRRLGHVELVDPSDVERGSVVSPLFVQHGTAFANTSPASTGNTTLVAGIVNQSVYVFGWELGYDQNTSGLVAIFLNDTVAAVATRFATIASSSPDARISGNYFGTPLTNGRGLIAETAALGTGPTTGRVHVSYSQF